MKRKLFFILFLFLLSCVAGYVLSKASLVGRIGIGLFYKQYKFLKVWWQAGLVIFIFWIVLFFVHERMQRKFSPKTAKLIHIGTIVVAVIGLYFTYQDFRHTTSHRWLGERFHLGGYLFWMGWISIAVFYLTEQQKIMLPVNENEPSVSANNNV